MAKTAYGFRETVESYKKISGSIRSRQLSPVYLLMGEENYFIDRLTDNFAGDILTEEEKAFNLLVLYGKETDAGAIVNICRQMPMMGDKQVVIIKEAQNLKKTDLLNIYLKAPSDRTILIFCHKGKNMDKRSQTYKLFSSAGTVFESLQPRDYECGSWIKEMISSKGYRLEGNALGLLTESLGTDLTKISNEIDKLTTFLPQDTVSITAEHIENNIGISKDFNNFELTRALSEKDTAKALLITSHFARNTKDNPLVVTISSLFTHFRRIFTYNYQIWYCRKYGSPAPNDMEMSRLLKLPSSFFLAEYKKAAGNYPNKKVFTILGLLREYDMKSKGMNTGNATDGELLRELLLQILLV